MGLLVRVSGFFRRFLTRLSDFFVSGDIFDLFRFLASRDSDVEVDEVAEEHEDEELERKLVFLLRSLLRFGESSISMISVLTAFINSSYSFSSLLELDSFRVSGISGVLPFSGLSWAVFSSFTGISGVLLLSGFSWAIFSFFTKSKSNSSSWTFRISFGLSGFKAAACFFSCSKSPQRLDFLRDFGSSFFRFSSSCSFFVACDLVLLCSFS